MVFVSGAGKGRDMAFFEKLNDSLTKERGGRHGGKGHEFQRYWALCHLLKSDLERDDFLILLEFIEDVTVLDAENNPTTMDLFQLKKKEGIVGKWTKANLSRPPKGSKSVLAKLCESRNIAKGETKSISFVSNAPVDLRLNNGEDSTARLEFSTSDLDEVLVADLRASIAKELCCDEGEIVFDNLRFVRSPLAIDDLESHATGKVSAYLAEKFPDHSARADVLCRALYSEIKIKATSTEDAGSFDDLKRIRGISKGQFVAMVSLTLSKRPDSDIINEAISSLIHEDVAYVDREAVKRASRRFLIDKSAKGVDLLARLRREIETQLKFIPGDLLTSWSVANWVIDQVISSDKDSAFSIVEREYLIAAALYWMNQ